ncbi:MAG: hypothetical protein HYT80_10880 [Euryarchaeota archaeon]|nr:hypothetical protein [Euryarchaeota archaeon]
MGVGVGALKYWLWTFLIPGPYYIFGGTLLWFMDVLSILGARDFGELAVAALAAYFDFPTSVQEAIGQHLVGGLGATLLWVIGMARYQGRG